MGYGPTQPLLSNKTWTLGFDNEGDIIQLLAMEALDMMRYRPENADIDRGVAKVNIGMLRSISHHVQ